MKKVLSVLLALGIILGVAGAALAADKPVVGMVMKSLSNEHFKKMEEGVRRWWENEDKKSFELITVGMNSETDIDTQISAIESLIAQKVDVMILAPADSAGIAPFVKKAMDAGIVVVNFDNRFERDALKAVGLPDDFLYVGPNDANGAYEVAKYIGTKLGKGAKVILLEGSPGADNARQRQEGFLKAVKECELEVLADVTAHWEIEEANSVTTNLLTIHPDVQGIITAADGMALGAIRAVEAAGKGGKILVSGYDNQEQAQQLIKEGRVLCTIDQFGAENAIEAIKIGLRIKNGEKFSGWIETPGKVITIDDLK
jgi:ribose transport system substrate-binding protein